MPLSKAGLFLRHKKERTDCAIREAYARLAQDPAAGAPATATFTTLLRYARARAPSILEAPVGGRHPGIDALVNLACAAPAFVRTPATWPGCDASWQAAISALARHLLGRYRVPVFLGAAWHAVGDPFAEAKRRWFIEHAAGASFRSLDLPMDMTRRMEHIFLASQEHVGIEYAMRRAELIALEAPADLIEAVLETSIASDLRHSDFWRTAWLFLINGWLELTPANVGPLIDFFQSIRHERIGIDAAGGLVEREPPRPDFSLEGRTPRSVLGLMEDWHRDVGSVHSGGLSWNRSRLQPMIVEVPSADPSKTPWVWELIELTTSGQLRAESNALQHCVASYDHRCWRGVSRIWSLRVGTDAKSRPHATIEFDPRRHAIVQARAYRNQPVLGRARLILRQWAAREQIHLRA